jgi:hypothetical protein
MARQKKKQRVVVTIERVQKILAIVHSGLMLAEKAKKVYDLLT